MAKRKRRPRKDVEQDLGEQLDMSSITDEDPGTSPPNISYEDDKWMWNRPEYQSPSVRLGAEQQFSPGIQMGSSVGPFGELAEYMAPEYGPSAGESFRIGEGESLRDLEQQYRATAGPYTEPVPSEPDRKWAGRPLDWEYQGLPYETETELGTGQEFLRPNYGPGADVPVGKGEDIADLMEQHHRTTQSVDPGAIAETRAGLDELKAMEEMQRRRKQVAPAGKQRRGVRD